MQLLLGNDSMCKRIDLEIHQKMFPTGCVGVGITFASESWAQFWQKDVPKLTVSEQADSRKGFVFWARRSSHFWSTCAPIPTCTFFLHGASYCMPDRGGMLRAGVGSLALVELLSQQGASLAACAPNQH